MRDRVRPFAIQKIVFIEKKVLILTSDFRSTRLANAWTDRSFRPSR